MTTVFMDKKGFQADFSPGGKLFGTVENAGTPNTPVSRRVQVFAQTSAFGILNSIFVTTVVSDTSGRWSVGMLDPAIKYGIIAYDHTGTYDPVVKMNLTPTVE
jgi:hypothetical protein